ncbi:hypothetical protein CAEBREN_19816 [Caenorhabditis brenneri]|uniref:Uncharacterized protein n=1 Tax=Caenorhabditis brenneri TaxID=135651 RepID=G0MHJ3_CAEBE|nr:hypothetical protein CAEBREN_19816 [Caenorhabditis brenneri]
MIGYLSVTCIVLTSPVHQNFSPLKSVTGGHTISISPFSSMVSQAEEAPPPPLSIYLGKQVQSFSVHIQMCFRASIVKGRTCSSAQKITKLILKSIEAKGNQAWVVVAYLSK